MFWGCSSCSWPTRCKLSVTKKGKRHRFRILREDFVQVIPQTRAPQHISRCACQRRTVDEGVRSSVLKLPSGRFAWQNHAKSVESVTLSFTFKEYFESFVNASTSELSRPGAFLDFWTSRTKRVVREEIFEACHVPFCSAAVFLPRPEGTSIECIPCLHTRVARRPSCVELTRALKGFLQVYHGW